MWTLKTRMIQRVGTHFRRHTRCSRSPPTPWGKWGGNSSELPASFHERQVRSCSWKLARRENIMIPLTQDGLERGYMLGTFGLDEVVRGPDESVRETRCHNHFCDFVEEVVVDSLKDKALIDAKCCNREAAAPAQAKSAICTASRAFQPPPSRGAVVSFPRRPWIVIWRFIHTCHSECDRNDHWTNCTRE